MASGKTSGREMKNPQSVVLMNGKASPNWLTFVASRASSKRSMWRCMWRWTQPLFNCCLHLVDYDFVSVTIRFDDDSKALGEIYRLVMVSMRYNLSFKSYSRGMKAELWKTGLRPRLSNFKRLYLNN